MIFLLRFLFLLAFFITPSTCSKPYNGFNNRLNQRKPHHANRSDIILILTDDQDVELGSMNFMPKTLKILAEGGVSFPNAYVTTPMCCPSRSSILTGIYSHNHNVHTNNENCSSPEWQANHEPYSFATYLHGVGYRTAFFGKYLNEYNGTYIPPGWRFWSALVRNSRFYNYTLNVNGKKVRHKNSYALDYYPDLILNESIAFYRKSKGHFPDKPVLMVLSFPSPHGPEDAAPQYQNLFFNVTTHRTISWNHAPNPDKQWLLRNVPKMKQIHKDFTDLLHTKRLQSLQSVDDAVHKLYIELLAIGTLNRTFIFYSSDHGYHLGQFGILKGKSMPFESDLKVPFYVRGPRIVRGSIRKEIVLNIDFAPTFLDIAGVQVPDFMDGRSILPLLRKINSARKIAWRDTFLIERGKVPKEKSEKSSDLNRRRWLRRACRQAQVASCYSDQEWGCIFDGTKVRIEKCKKFKSGRTAVERFNSTSCKCRTANESSTFNKNGSVSLETKRKYARPRRNLDNFDIGKVYDLSHVLDVVTHDHENIRVDNSMQFHEQSLCLLMSNSSMLCPNEEAGKSFSRPSPRGSLSRQHLQQHSRRRDAIKSEGCPCDSGELSKIWRRRLREIRREQLKKRLKKMRRKMKFEKSNCNFEKMTCFTHDDSHWKTPPLWKNEPFCFCQNAQNNTFWCLRTINDTHNYLYCEFVTGFITFYDFLQDPHQLENKVLELNWHFLKSLRVKLNSLKGCSGYKDCNKNS